MAWTDAAGRDPGATLSAAPARSLQRLQAAQLCMVCTHRLVRSIMGASADVGFLLHSLSPPSPLTTDEGKGHLTWFRHTIIIQGSS